MKFASIVASLLLTASAVGQLQMRPVTSGSVTSQVVDHMANCIYPTAHNCWNTRAGGSYVQVTTSPGISGSYHPYTVGVDSNGCIAQYSDPVLGGNNSWSPIAQGCGLSQYQIGANGGNYALFGTCSTGKYYGQWDGANNVWFQRVSGCYKSYSMDFKGSGLVGLIDTNGAIWESFDYGTTATQTGWCSGNGGGLSISVLAHDTFGIICNDNSIWSAQADSSSVYHFPGAGYQITGYNGRVFVTGTDRNVYRWIIGTNTNWDHIYSSGVVWLNYDPVNQSVWTLVSGSGVPQRLTEWSSAFTRIYHATTQCTGSCPNQHSNPPVFHVAQTQAQFVLRGTVVATGPLVSSGHVDPITQVTLQSTVVPDSVIDCFINAADCVVAETPEKYTCNEEGTLNSGGGSYDPSFQHQMAYTKMAVEQGTQPRCGPDQTATLYQCVYTPVTPACDNTATPMFQPISIMVTAYPHGGPPNSFMSFDTSSNCFNFGSGWWCLGTAITEADAAYTEFTVSNSCTPTY